MHATLTELLENLKSGLLWVNREGVVRYANRDACARTALGPGRKLYDPDLTRAVVEAVTAGVPRAVSATGTASGPGAPVPELKCRVIPGLSRDDAFVFIGNDAADQGVAYENLMLVIRSELRDPLQQTRQALELARDGEVHAVDSLADSLDELLQVLDKLVELASVWGTGPLLATDRIELWPMLRQVWADVEPLAVDRRVKVRFQMPDDTGTSATLYGSDQWLRRVFRECLESAVRSARGGTSLQVEHRQMGPRALIVFRDSGLFAGGAASSAPTRSGAAAAAKMPARDHIGLKLCQHVVALHGGQLREEHEDGTRNFLIDLPTGAPFRSDGLQLDAAQAQQYARDLAALMSRARRRSATPEATKE